MFIYILCIILLNIFYLHMTKIANTSNKNLYICFVFFLVLPYFLQSINYNLYAKVFNKFIIKKFFSQFPYKTKQQQTETVEKK